MKTFEQILMERFVNALDSDDRQKYADEVWDILTTSYAKLGGLTGSGFSSKAEMVAKIPFWKIARYQGKIVAVALYKDTGGRKRVACGTDGTATGKKFLKEMYKADFERAYFEISGPSLRFAVNMLGIDFVIKYAQPREKAGEIMGKEVSEPSEPEMTETYPALQKFMYDRVLGGSPHTKIMLGTPGKKIVVLSD